MKLKLTALRTLGIVLLVTSLSYCKKDIDTNSSDDTLTETRLGSGFSSVNIAFDAREISYKTYKNGVDNSPQKQHKLLASYQIEKTYSYKLEANRQSCKFTIDKIENKTPVDSWNKTEGKPYRIISDGVSLSTFDRNGNTIFRGLAEKSGVGSVKMIEDLSKVVDKRPIDLKMQEFIALGAKVKKSNKFFFVMTFKENQNFKKNAIFIYSIATGSIVCSTLYDDVDINKAESTRLMHYDQANNPIEIYTENYEYLQDGDVETSVTILKLQNTTFNIQ